MDWLSLRRQSGGLDDASYHGGIGLKALEILVGKDVILEATRGAIALHPQWLLMEGILAILQSELSIAEAYNIYKGSINPTTKAGCLRIMREVPNRGWIKHFEELLQDPDVAVQAAQVLEKQLWYSPGLREDPQMVHFVELAEQHADPAVRDEAVAARRHLYSASEDE